jgi:hypothetical protein
MEQYDVRAQCCVVSCRMHSVDESVIWLNKLVAASHRLAVLTDPDGGLIQRLAFLHLQVRINIDMDVLMPSGNSSLSRNPRRFFVILFSRVSIFEDNNVKFQG